VTDLTSASSRFLAPWEKLPEVGERLERVHKAHTRDNFALGALRAAKWVVGRPPGMYDMMDVLGTR